tara:strand:+ start:971 stop:1357 length:387 start_codon:yes stop_codon:yes gene_type:complete
MSNYSKLTNFTAKDSLPTGDSAKLIKGTEIDSELVAISAAITTKANTAAPAFTGVPTAPTAALGNSTGQLATTTFVANAVAAVGTLSAFTIVEDGTNLLFKYNGTAVARLTSAGAFSVIDNVTAYDTI